ncbi:DNA cytosine methyltransferase [Bradyrhizobium sp. TM239]|uniref:DNA cytosine methyltransferase n=1 Tax=Bradyrhizobium sp. TM239 TaxID=2599802 RepID=UPI0027D6A3D6|nr:DNA cytosine methyltransferase [Bradyrhizobium sp. TM239]
MSAKKRLSAVDLYAGAGGLSVGLSEAGFRIEAAVEQDKWAATTFSNNVDCGKVVVSSVAELPDDFFAKHKGVDLVVGGPPCQGFSVTAANRRNAGDTRNLEVFRFLEAAFRLKAGAIVLENVPPFTGYRLESGQLLLESVLEKLAEQKYDARYFIADCADFGVPQNRRRLFLMAAKKGRLPDLLSFRSHSGPDVPLLAQSRWISVEEAISDLPPTGPGMLDEDDAVDYTVPPQTPFQEVLRGRSAGSVYNHVSMRHSERLVRRFAAIPIGGNGLSVWDEHSARKRGDTTQEGTRFHQNHRRVDPNRPSPTITAFMYSTCLHPFQHRNLTVREAARLQTFPDWFRFFGKRTTLSSKLLARKGLVEDMGLNQLNQVGNAVPPRMGAVIGQALTKTVFA